MTIGDRIAQYRRREGLSQEALAEKLGISRQSVSKWERNESLPEADKIPLLAQIFSVSADQLLTGEDPLPPKEPSPILPPSRRAGGWEWICWLFRRWGWIGGLILAGYGVLIGGAGLAARAVGHSVLPPQLFPEAYPITPFTVFSGILLAVGGAAILGGLIAALVLWRKRPR